MKKLLSMFLALGLCVSLIGCGGNELKPQDTVTAMIDSYKAKKLDEMNAYFNGSDWPEEGISLDQELEGAEEELMKAFIEKLTDVDYTIDKETVDGDNATVKVTITANNIAEKMAEGLQQAILVAFGLAFSEKSEEEIQKIVADTMLTPIKDCEKNYKNIVEVKLVKNKDGKWVIVHEESDELFNALTGGLLEFSKELQNMSEETGE